MERMEGKDIAKLLDYNSKIKKRLIFMMIPIMMRKHKDSKSSTCQDIEKGKRTEIEAINGVVASHGDRVGINTPINDRVIHIVKGMEQCKVKQGMENLELFEDLL